MHSKTAIKKATANMYSRKLKKSYDLNQIVDLYVNQKKGCLQISQIVGCNRRYVLQVIRKAGFEVRSHKEATELAGPIISQKQKGVPKKFPQEWHAKMKQAGINKRKFKLSREELKKLYVLDGLKAKQIGDLVGCVDSTVLNWLARYNIPRRKGGPGKWWLGKKNPTMLKRNMLDNPAKRPEVREKNSRRMKAYYLKNPEKHPNHKLRRNHMTKVERIFEKLLNSLNLVRDKDYHYNQYIKVEGTFLFPDFILPDKKVIFEVDGLYWHDSKRDAKRDKLLEGRGYVVNHISDKQLLSKPDEVAKLVKNAIRKY